MRSATNLGLIIALLVIGGFFLGLFLDGALGTKPVLTFVFSTMGFIFGSVSVLILVKRRGF